MRKASGDVGRAHVVEQHREVVGTDAGDEIGGTQAFFDPLGHDHEQLIADDMTERVVNPFAPLHMNIEQRLLGAGPA